MGQALNSMGLAARRRGDLAESASTMAGVATATVRTGIGVAKNASQGRSGNASRFSSSAAVRGGNPSRSTTAGASSPA